MVPTHHVVLQQLEATGFLPRCFLFCVVWCVLLLFGRGGGGGLPSLFCFF